MNAEARFFENEYAKGNAVGGSYIQNDSIVLRYRDEVFEFPAKDIFEQLETNGTYYVMKVEKARKLARRK